MTLETPLDDETKSDQHVPKVNQSRLARRLLWIILSIYLLVAIVITGFQLAVEFELEKRNIHNDIAYTIDSLQPILSLQLWNFEEDAVVDTSQAILRNSYITGVRILGELNQEIIGLGDLPDVIKMQGEQLPVDGYPNIHFREVISENFMVAGGKPRYYLQQIREHYPIVMHGVSLSIGSTEPLDQSYLRQLKQLMNDLQPAWLSDHLCWTGVDGVNSHDLLPLPYTEEAIQHVVERLDQVQDFLGRQILLENVSSYISYQESELTEWEFYSEVVERADCLMLLDINNIYVSARNHGFDPQAYINAIDADRVQQFHLAGHSDYGSYVIDTHDHDIPDPVWQLYRDALKRFGPVSTMIERDDHIPSLDALIAELDIVRRIAADTLPEISEPLTREVEA